MDPVFDRTDEMSRIDSAVFKRNDGEERRRGIELAAVVVKGDLRGESRRSETAPVNVANSVARPRSTTGAANARIDAHRQKYEQDVLKRSSCGPQSHPLSRLTNIHLRVSVPSKVRTRTDRENDGRWSHQVSAKADIELLNTPHTGLSVTSNGINASVIGEGLQTER